MFSHDCYKRVRYGDTDQMGYLYYGNYPMLYEIGRSEAIRSLGTSYKYMEDELGIMMPVIHMESRYLTPLRYDENAKITTILKELPTKMVHFHHEIYNTENKLCHRGSVKLFFVDMKSNQRVDTPQYLQDLLKPYF